MVGRRYTAHEASLSTRRSYSLGLTEGALSLRIALKGYR
jgi:hypothetical protein